MKEEMKEVIKWLDGARIQQQPISVFLMSSTIMLSFPLLHSLMAMQFCQRDKKNLKPSYKTKPRTHEG